MGIRPEDIYDSEHDLQQHPDSQMEVKITGYELLGSEVLLYFGEDVPNETVKVPDFAGMNRQQASDAAGALGLYILVAGNDGVSPSVLVTAQEIPAGELAEKGTTIKLEFTDTKASD